MKSSSGESWEVAEMTTKEIEILGRKLRRTHSGLELGSQSESSAQTVK